MEKISAEQRIREAGFKATKPRVAVFEYLQTIKQPQNIQDIAAALQSVMDQVTVYRTIENFKKAGLVREVDLQEGRPCFELADDEHDHHHLVCVRCKRVEDFIGCDYDNMANKALSQVSGFTSVTNHSFELFGMCTSCSTK